MKRQPKNSRRLCVTMSGRLGNLKRRKGKFSSEAPGSNKASAGRRKDIKKPKNETSDTTTKIPQSRSTVYGHSTPSSPSDRLSYISCECQKLPDRTRCAASPELEGPEGKENEVRMRLESDCCIVNGFREKVEGMDDGSADKNIYPDEDSNQILPVEHFFGNIDVVQDCPQRHASTSTWGSREHRRRHYYAKDDSDEEEEVEGSTDMQQDDRGGS